MNNESLVSKMLKEDDADKNKPLSEEELSSLIQASRDGTFTPKEIKKETDNSFKKVSLHDIAKKYSEEPSTYKEEINQNKEEKSNDKEKTNTEEEKEKNHSKEEEKLNETLDNQALNAEEPSETIEEEKTLLENEHLNIVEDTKKKSFEEGKSMAYSEIKEGADAAIAKLKSISEKISKTDEFDLVELETLVSKKILELTSELTGKIIKALPTEFLKKIKDFTSSLNNNTGKIEIFINQEDFMTLEKNKNIKSQLKEMNISSNSDLLNGEVVLQINGINIKHTISNKI